MDEAIKGEKVTLRPSTLNDRRQIFEWLAHSDLTSFMLGPPHFPDNPTPTWEEFIHDYHAYFFDGSAPTLGRCFVIEVEGNAIGQVNYNEVDDTDHSTELDIWLSDSKYTNKGYGTDALEALCNYLNSVLGCKKFIIAPSKRNIRAVKAYQKAGFTETTSIPESFIPDYHDTVVMVKTINKG